MYLVRWHTAALNELAQLWLDADAAMRKAITAATNQVDQQFSADPMGKSESRPGGRRILFQFPLIVTYRIEDDEATVSVLRVWLFRRRKA